MYCLNSSCADGKLRGLMHCLNSSCADGNTEDLVYCLHLVLMAILRV